MGFFQNLKEDYEAAVDELLGGESAIPEEEAPKTKKSRGRKKSSETMEDTEQVALNLDMMAPEEDTLEEEIIHEDLVEDDDMELESEIVSEMSDISELLDGLEETGQDGMSESEMDLSEISALFADETEEEAGGSEEPSAAEEVPTVVEEEPAAEESIDDKAVEMEETADEKSSVEEETDDGDDGIEEIEEDYADDDLDDDDLDDDDLDDVDLDDDDLSDDVQGETKEEAVELPEEPGDLSEPEEPENISVPEELPEDIPEPEELPEDPEDISVPEEPVKPPKAEAPSIFRKLDEHQNHKADIVKEEEKSKMAVENLIEEEVSSKTVIPELAEEEVMEVSDETATITKGMKVAGNIKSNGNLDLEGVVVGNIRIAGKANIFGEINGDTEAGNVYADGAQITGAVKTTGSVKVAQSSVIIGDIVATSAVIAGAVKGNIDVHGPVILDSTAIVMGDIKSQSVQITSGAVVEGMCSQCYAKVSPASFFDQLGK